MITEAQNVALRQSVRQDRFDLTDIHPIFYPGERLKRLNLITSAHVQTTTEPDVLAEPAIVIPPGEPFTKTFIQKTFVVGNGSVFPATYRMTGRFKITHLSFFQEGAVMQRAFWGLSSNPSPPTTFAGWLFTRRIFPYSYVNAEANLPEMYMPDPVHYPLANTINLSYQALILCIFYDGPQGGDNYITSTMTVENSPP